MVDRAGAQRSGDVQTRHPGQLNVDDDEVRATRAEPPPAPASPSVAFEHLVGGPLQKVSARARLNALSSTHRILLRRHTVSGSVSAFNGMVNRNVEPARAWMPLNGSRPDTASPDLVALDARLTLISEGAYAPTPWACPTTSRPWGVRRRDPSPVAFYLDLRRRVASAYALLADAVVRARRTWRAALREHWARL